MADTPAVIYAAKTALMQARPAPGTPAVEVAAWFDQFADVLEREVALGEDDAEATARVAVKFREVAAYNLGEVLVNASSRTRRASTPRRVCAGCHHTFRPRVIDPESLCESCTTQDALFADAPFRIDSPRSTGRRHDGKWF